MTADEARAATGRIVTMTDLRVGSRFPVVVERVEADGRVIVRDTDSGSRYRVGATFLADDAGDRQA